MAKRKPRVKKPRANRAQSEDEGALRRCIVTGESLPKSALIRFVVGPDGEIVPDVDEKLPGRGLWLSARRDIVCAARDKKQFAKAARAQVTVPADLDDRIEALLARRSLDLLALARRAGDVVSGFDKVRECLKSGRARLVIAASDGAADGRAKVDALAAAIEAAGGKKSTARQPLTLFSGAELGGVTGRERTVHVAVSSASFAERISALGVRLAGFRDASMTSADGERKEVAAQTPGH